MVISFLLCFQSKAQNADFVFSLEFNSLVAKKEGKSPYAFEILSQKHSTIIKKPASKSITQFYKRALVFSKKAKSDSAKIANLKKEGKYTLEIAKKLNEKDVNNRLRIAKRGLKNTKKYETVPSKVIVKKFDALKIRRTIFKPENVIIGEFKRLGSYYIANGTKGYIRRSLITTADVKKNKLTIDNFLIDSVFEVIQNIETKTIYMVYPDFLEKYAINSHKNYSNGPHTDIDKVLDH